YVPQVGIINPSEFAPANSIEEAIWVAVGGRGTLTGAIVGALVVNYGKTLFTSGTVVPFWQIGAVAAVFALGIIGRQRRTALGMLAGGALAAAGWPFQASLPFDWPSLVAGVALVAALATSWSAGALGAIFGAMLFRLFVTPSESLAL